MESNNIAKGILIAGYKLLLFFIGIYLIIALNELIIHLAIAGVLALIGRPIVLFIERKLKFSSLLAATITLFFFLLE
jgi:predicted PurR-regulated permease PerM